MMSTESKLDRKLRILVIPLNAHGHINACHGLCDELRNRGHQITFLLDEEFKGRLKKYGFEEEIVKTPQPMDVNGQDVEFWQGFMAKHQEIFEKSPEDHIKELFPMIYLTEFEQQKLTEEEYRRIIEKVKPDLIISDLCVYPVPIIQSGIPWIWSFSTAPYFLLQDPCCPPFFSGLPYNGDKNEWKRFTEITKKAFKPVLDAINDYCRLKAVPPVVNDEHTTRLHPLSPFLNLVMWPKEIRPKEFEKFPENIKVVDCFLRKVPEQRFELPEKLRNKPGKLIYFSMGSFGSSHLKMMRRLMEMLSHSPHRFIVSKGPLDYELADNMWGEPFVPQPAILPMVDLVITHGGNNTVTESFYYGKKMLVLPMFADQLDTAQRISEVGLGRKLNPFTCSQNELLETIQTLLDDEQLTKQMFKIGQRIRSSQEKEEIVDHIENMINKWLA